MKILFASTPWAGERHGSGPRQLNQVRSAGPCLCVPWTDSPEAAIAASSAGRWGSAGLFGRPRPILAGIHSSPPLFAGDPGLRVGLPLKRGDRPARTIAPPDLDSVGPVSLPDDLVGGVGCEAVRGSGTASLRQVQRRRQADPPLSQRHRQHSPQRPTRRRLRGILERIRAKASGCDRFLCTSERGRGTTLLFDA